MFSVFVVTAVVCLTSKTTTHAESILSSSQASNIVAEVLEGLIPREYEKSKDWGRTKNVTVGVRADGIKLHRRKKPVKHGVWKRYRIRLVEPDEKLNLQIENVHAISGGKYGCTLRLDASVDLWARAKIYQYGVHLIAVEALGDAAIELQIDCELGLRLQTHDGRAGVSIDPRVADARLNIVDFRLRRISNAKGPVVRELGEELPRLLKEELQGPKFVAKLNRAIDKKRDRLEVGFSDLWQ